MNRHRSGWSAMGQELRTEPSQQEKDYKELRKDLKRMINRFGTDEVVTELRRIILNSRNVEE